MNKHWAYVSAPLVQFGGFGRVRALSWLQRPVKNKFKDQVTATIILSINLGEELGEKMRDYLLLMQHDDWFPRFITKMPDISLDEAGGGEHNVYS